jgi:hypothetical protein
MSQMRSAAAALAAAALLSPPAAFAGTYSIVARTPDSWTVVDPAAAESLAGGIKRLSSVTVQKSISPRGPPRPGYVKSLSEYDCALRKSRWIQFVLYDRSGAVVISQKNPKPDWSEPTRGTDAGSTLALLCGQYGGVDLPAVSATSLGGLVLSLFAGWDQATAPVGLPAAAPSGKTGRPAQKAPLTRRGARSHASSVR